MIWLHLTVGRGPIECHSFLKSIIPIIEQDTIQSGLKMTVLDYEDSTYGLISALVSIEGKEEESFAKSWNGSIEWVCKSELRPNHKRKRWFIGASSLTLGHELSTEINDHDLKWDYMRASGPGGQNVQKTDSAVRLTHQPTGIVVFAQEERSQYRNKSLAKDRLLSKLNELNDKKNLSDDKIQWNNHNSLERGNAIRTYEGINLQKK
jgi:peptide chain release factor